MKPILTCLMMKDLLMMPMLRWETRPLVRCYIDQCHPSACWEGPPELMSARCCCCYWLPSWQTKHWCDPALMSSQYRLIGRKPAMEKWVELNWCWSKGSIGKMIDQHDQGGGGMFEEASNLFICNSLIFMNLIYIFTWCLWVSRRSRWTGCEEEEEDGIDEEDLCTVSRQRDFK